MDRYKQQSPNGSVHSFSCFSFIHRMNMSTFKKGKKLLILSSIICLTSSCYMVDYFQKSTSKGSGSSTVLPVLGEDLGPKAGTRNEAALASVYAVTTTHLPAAVRPDPDLLARRLLRQFRAEGTTLARTIGSVENYRQLLGGASADFSVAPSLGYDATSVLAAIKVAEEVCQGLVAPVSWEHQGWQTILPHAVGDKRSNLQFLVQRLTGISEAKIDHASLDSLEQLLDDSDTNNQIEWTDYVNPCAAIVVDAKAMLF
ncbi:MAG: hypothetical protein NT027_12865 [Proteobacteria bacterium]|nr:hypothetical protein [Pseudomonadota bacterium]